MKDCILCYPEKNSRWHRLRTVVQNKALKKALLAKLQLYWSASFRNPETVEMLMIIAYYSEDKIFSKHKEDSEQEEKSLASF